MLDIKVLPLGTRVEFGIEEKIPGEIVGVQIVNYGEVLYDIEWWNGRDMNKGLFIRTQFTTVATPTTRIGFGMGA